MATLGISRQNTCQIVQFYNQEIEGRQEIETFIGEARVQFDTIQIPMVKEFNLQHDMIHGRQEQQPFAEMAPTVLAKAEEAHVLIMVEWKYGTNRTKNIIESKQNRDSRYTGLNDATDHDILRNE